MRIKDTILGKKVCGTNAYGQPVGRTGTVIAVYPRECDKYGNYPITVKYPDNELRNTMSFWVKVVQEVTA
jgi:hypothetical protein